MYMLFSYQAALITLIFFKGFCMSNSASVHLASYNVSIQQAYDFIFSNLTNPSMIFNTCKQFGISNQMISEITGSVSSWIPPETVRSYFIANGLNAYQLDSLSVLSFENRIFIHTFDNEFFNYKLGPLNAGGGSYNFVIDLSQNAPTSSSSSKSAVQTIINFGADDSLVFKNSTSVYVAVSSYSAASFGQTVKVSATSQSNGSYDDVYLIGVNSNSSLVYNANSFNSLPVGDIFIA